MCDCESCTFNRLVSDKIEALPEGVRDFFEDLHEKFCMVSQDLDQANAIIDGTWPSSDEYIRSARSARKPIIPEPSIRYPLPFLPDPSVYLPLKSKRSCVVIDLFSGERIDP